jgi:hypothetical protein
MATETIKSAVAPFATECDLIMKGGIVSGIVYPLAICEIAKAFRLRSIGGTSAGAIAAAAAAAAELGRQRYKNRNVAADPGGFDLLSKLPEYLSSDADDGRGTKLLAFFKPEPALRLIFAGFTAASSEVRLAARAKVVLGACFSEFKWVALCIFLLGILPLFGLPMTWGSLLAIIWIYPTVSMTAAVFISWIVSVVWILVVLAFAMVLSGLVVLVCAANWMLHGLVSNGFAFCSGMPAEDEAFPEEVLTVWLSNYLDLLSGQEQMFPNHNKPLTFGDLKDHCIDLQVITTCLTLGRPFILPFRDDEVVKENNRFLFKKVEFEKLFPPYVVEWLVANERKYDPLTSHIRFKQVNFDGFYNLPEPKDLPVVIAIRMSLSFPLLLSAIPLYSIDFQKPNVPGEVPEYCWFTDGGIGSNFPIHFFDKPLPKRPTFGLDIGKAEYNSKCRVVFPKDNGETHLNYWRRFAKGDGYSALAGFISTIANVAKDWNHEALSHLPGFRDRIGLIKLTDKEGGLNLTMSKTLIVTLMGYGREAGREFVRRFGDPNKWMPGTIPISMNWENHQFIRLRLLVACVSEMTSDVNKALTDLADSPTDYARFFTQGYQLPSYRFTNQNQADLVKWVLNDLSNIAQHIPNSGVANHPSRKAPKPLPELKMRPRV